VRALLRQEHALLLVEHAEDRRLAPLRDERVQPLGGLLGLDDVVREELGRGVDRGQDRRR